MCRILRDRPAVDIVNSHQPVIVIIPVNPVETGRISLIGERNSGSIVILFLSHYHGVQVWPVFLRIHLRHEDRR